MLLCAQRVRAVEQSHRLHDVQRRAHGYRAPGTGGALDLDSEQASRATNRTTSGAGFYGAMELSGNLHDMIVTLGKSQGRQFLGTHGDGNLTTISGYEGNATNIDWPGIDVSDARRGVTGSVGIGNEAGQNVDYGVPGRSMT